MAHQDFVQCSFSLNTKPPKGVSSQRDKIDAICLADRLSIRDLIGFGISKGGCGVGCATDQGTLLEGMGDDPVMSTLPAKFPAIHKGVSGAPL